MTNLWIATFSSRILAFIIDLTVLVCFGFCLGLVYEASFVQLGERGELIGMVIALIYFGVLNSRLGGGKTIGKRLIKIKVVDADNQTIDIFRSFVRYSILVAPLSLIGIGILNKSLLAYILYPLTSIVIASGLVASYLYLFNRITRQSLHDLVMSTVVVRAEVEPELLSAVWRPHLIVAILVAVSATIIPAFIPMLEVPKSETNNNLMVISSVLTRHPSISAVDVVAGRRLTTAQQSGVVHYIDVQVMLAEDVIDDIELARQLARVVVINYAEAREQDEITIRLSYGFAIGIWSQWSHMSHSFHPAELLEESSTSAI